MSSTSAAWADLDRPPLQDPIDLLIEYRVKLQIQLDAGEITQAEYDRTWKNVTLAACVLYGIADLPWLETRLMPFQ